MMQINVKQSVEQSMSTIKKTIHILETAQDYMDRTDNRNWSQEIINTLNTANHQLEQYKN
ncbi:hypothetical protein DES36_12025 [Alkalibaculum bacchi]|uniref:Uncharacterized protein n=1 Tax=Alkalibaculum bacchi TaxID=645887 RepID=A0A366I0T4_9FIRM|nr:hypothetical protein [Alkalibaculum bacchi]RBP59083.1 hypothetical protein DES36_12025 [Alkalibaculum bacchi]